MRIPKRPESNVPRPTGTVFYDSLVSAECIAQRAEEIARKARAIGSYIMLRDNVWYDGRLRQKYKISKTTPPSVLRSLLHGPFSIAPTDSPYFGTIGYDGEVYGDRPLLEMHIDTPAIEEEDEVLGAQATRIAQMLAESGLAEAYPVLTVRSYPELAKVAVRTLEMEPAIATYSPPHDVATRTVMDIYAAQTKYRRENGIAAASRPHIDTALMSTRAFIDRWA